MEQLIPNRTPWKSSVEERVADFHANRHKKRILFLHEDGEAATFRYRGYNTAQALKHSARWSLHYFYMKNELPLVEQMLPECDLLVLCRCPWTQELDLLLGKAKFLHIPILYDVDDLVFDLQRAPMLVSILDTAVDTLEGREYKLRLWFANVARIHLAASRADGFLVTNAFLGERVSEVFHKPYQVIRNSLNEEQLLASEVYASQKQPRQPGAPFTIGYFSGSPTHMNDLMTVIPELELFLGEHPDARLQIVGYLELPPCMQPFVAKGQVLFHPFVDFVELQQLIANVDVNIAPLLENEFTNCKSELKYFEAAIVNTLTLASPTYTFQRAIKHGENGFLCRPGTWYQTLQDVYNQRVDMEAIARNGHSHAIEQYSGETVLRELEAAFDYFSRA